jgi:hypothetical protein
MESEIKNHARSQRRKEINSKFLLWRLEKNIMPVKINIQMIFNNFDYNYFDFIIGVELSPG